MAARCGRSAPVIRHVQSRRAACNSYSDTATSHDAVYGHVVDNGQPESVAFLPVKVGYEDGLIGARLCETEERS